MRARLESFESVASVHTEEVPDIAEVASDLTSSSIPFWKLGKVGLDFSATKFALPEDVDRYMLIFT